MNLQKQHLLFVFPLTVSAFMLEGVVWMFQRFNRFFIPSSFMFDALLVSFVPFVVYWHLKNWATCSKTVRAILILYWIAALSLIAVYSLSFVLAMLGT